MSENCCPVCGRPMEYGECRWSDCPNNYMTVDCGQLWERGFCGQPDKDPCRNCTGCDVEEDDEG